MQTNRLNIMAKADVGRRGSTNSKFLLILMAMLASFCMVGSVWSAYCPPPMTGANWMCFVPDETSLFNMSLPGTHETMARFPEPPSDLCRGFIDYYVGQNIRSHLPWGADTVYRCTPGVCFIPCFCDASIADAATNYVWLAFLSLGSVGLDIVQFFATCQPDDLKTQLDNGIRVVDIRFLHIGDQFLLYHDTVPMNDETNSQLEFGRDVLAVVTDWLASHPTETIVMRLRNEHADLSTGDDVLTFYSYLGQPNPKTGWPFGYHIWQPGPGIDVIPWELGLARGKLIILQDKWNRTDAYFGVYSGMIYTGAMGDDSWKITNLSQLWSLAGTQLVNTNTLIRAGVTASTGIFSLTPLNANWPADILTSYFSAPKWMATGEGEKLVLFDLDSVDDWVAVALGYYNPISLATKSDPNGGMNFRMNELLNKQCGVFRTGIVSMDFPPPTLIQDVYRLNSFPSNAPIPPSLPDVISQSSSAALPAAPTATDSCGNLITGTTTSTGPFGPGNYTIMWEFTDAIGNSSYATQAVHVDPNPPVVTIIQPNAVVYSQSATISLDYKVTDADTGVASVTATLDGKATVGGFLLGSALAPGTHTLTVTGVDYAGNSSSSSVTFLVEATENTGNYITQWGSQGSGNGQFSEPSSVAIDSSENVYVLDSGNKRIEKFSSTGSYITQWGSYGYGNGQFEYPWGMAVDSSGNVYVCDPDNDRIEKFSSSGSYITKWGSYGYGNGQFEYPWGVAVDSSGNVYVSDRNNNRIQKFSSTGSYITQWGSQGSGNGQFNYPGGVAVDSSGNVYVIDFWNNRIQKFSSTGTYIGQRGSQGSGNGQFNKPGGVAVDSSGNVYVADSGNNRIQKFSSTGTYITQWGSLGQGNGQFNNPGGVAVDSQGNVYVADTGNYRIQKFGQASSTVACPNFPSEVFYFFDPNAAPFNLRFSWNSVSDATSYDAQICSNSDCSSTVLTTSSKINAWQVVSGLNPNTSYWFRLRSVNSSCNGAWGGIPFATSSCGYSLLPQAYAYSPEGRPGTVTVTPSSGSCAWTATSDDSWIHIMSGYSGTGNGTVLYYVDVNTTGIARKGYIIIGGQGFTVYQAGSTFIDDPQNNFTPYINAIYTEGITTGCGNGYYCPSAEVTRGQMAAFIIRSIYGEYFSYTTTPYFTDVPDTHGFFKYVQKMKDTGLTTVSGTYMVDDVVTRGQMAAFIIRAKYGESFTYTTTPYFTDVPDTHGFFKYVQKMKDTGITAVTGTYNVDGLVTRDQMAAFLARAFLWMQ